MARKTNKDKFLEKAKKIHGDKYDYSKVNYITAKTDVIIICKKHGDFIQKPTNHLYGGCKKCGIEKVASAKRYTKEKFLIAAKRKHGDKYNYSKVQYKNQQKEVIIICPNHGEFLQKPTYHIRGGCKKCAMEYVVGKRRLTKEEFVSKAKEVHGNKYDYSKVVYVNANTKILIKCPKHGWFLQRPQGHLNGQCNKCGVEQLSRTKTLNTEHFIKKAREVHGDRYDYSKSKYLSGRKKILIICRIHGEFKQEVYGHYSGDNCPRCAHLQRRLTTSEFIKKAKLSHGEKYDYSKTEYTKSLDDVIIICPTHGEFTQTANTHLSGCGCDQCGELIAADKRRLTKEQFIERAQLIHRGRYNYSQVNYVSSDKDVSIICNQHGIFNQSPGNHFNGRGCPSCAKTGYKISNEAILYLNEIKLNNGKHAIKYGITNRKYQNRARRQRKSIDGVLINIFKYKSSGLNVLNTETLISQLFDHKGYLTKEEMSDGFTETVKYSEENLETIMSIIDKELIKKD